MNSQAAQYTAVALIVLAAIIWMAVRLMRTKKSKGGACAGCSLADACSKNRNRKR